MSGRFDTGCLNPMTTIENTLTVVENIRPELHVAQQSRRDKLRIHHNLTPFDHIKGIPSHFGELPLDLGLNPDLIRAQNVRNSNLPDNSAICSSEMLHSSTKNHVLSAPRGVPVPEESGAGGYDGSVGTEEASYANCSFPISINFNPSSKVNGLHNTIYSKGVESHKNPGRSVKYVNASESSSCNQCPPLIEEIMSRTTKVKNISESSNYLRPGDHGYQYVQSSMTNPCSEISSQESQRHCREIYFNSRSFCANSSQEFGTSSTIGSQELESTTLVKHDTKETGHVSWVYGEHALLPNSRYQVNCLQLDQTAAWLHWPVGASLQWSGETGFVAANTDSNLVNVAIDCRAKGLSLSLSSHLPSDINIDQLGETYGSADLQYRSGYDSGLQDLNTDTSISLYCNSTPKTGNKGCENSIRVISGSAVNAHQCTGPLGPFTGYATILKNSKFLKPAQQLLDECCSITGLKVTKKCDMSEKGYEDLSISSDTGNTEAEICGKGVNSGYPSIFYNPTTVCCETSVVNWPSASCEADCQQKKAMLLNMQKEVCKRYKKYHQQMKMVVSSFESVAELSSATPYTSLALKTVSRQFRWLKNTISEQLRHLSNVVGEDLSSPNTGASSSKGDGTIPRLKVIDHSLWGHRTGGNNMGFLETQQHSWRSQRGLPERAVSILRAWLFEHFLHPYPTDTDKHMLATHTGLTRNQVSNWFINARVRLWKPMIEEIHELETVGSARTNLNSDKCAGKPKSDVGSKEKQPPNELTVDAVPDKRLQCSLGVESMTNTEEEWRGEELHEGKRSGMDFQIATADMEGSLMGLVANHHGNAIEIGELGTVSLTLGLRHSAESATQQQQLQQEEHLLGGQMIQDFVG